MAKRLFAILAACAVLFTACDTAEVGAFHVTQTVFNNISPEGSCLQVNYVIDTAVEGASVTASSECDWLQDIHYYPEDSFVQVCPALNESTEPRSGVVTLKYAGASVDVTFNQLGAFEM
mgnify:FL=1